MKIRNKIIILVMMTLVVISSLCTVYAIDAGEQDLEFESNYIIQKNDDGVETYTVVRYTANIGTNQIVPKLEGKTITRIANGAFKDNSSIMGIVTIPDTVTYIGSEAFSGCSRISGLTLGNELKYIGEKAFYGCYGIAYVDFNSKLENIGNEAFSRCTHLVGSFVEIPRTVRVIGQKAFANTNLSVIKITSKEAPMIYDNSFADLSKTEIRIPENGIGYESTAGWPENAKRIYYGDIDGNKKTNADDASKIVDIFKSRSATKEELEIADLDNNGKLNADDITLIIDRFKEE